MKNLKEYILNGQLQKLFENDNLEKLEQIIRNKDLKTSCLEQQFA